MSWQSRRGDAYDDDLDLKKLGCQLAGYEAFHSFGAMLGTFMSWAAFAEILKRDFMTVNTWLVLVSVWFGLHIFSLGGMLSGIIYRLYPGRDAKYATKGVNHSSWVIHGGLGLFSRLMLLLLVIRFEETNHDSMAAFNDRRFISADRTAAETDMYNQWTAFLILTAVFTFIDLFMSSHVWSSLVWPKVRLM